MPRISNIEILKQGEQHILSVRTRVPMSRLPETIGENYAKMAAYLSNLNEYLSDVPFVAYRNRDPEDLDVETGFPVSSPLPGREEIRPGVIAAGKKIFCLYMGAYSRIEPVYEEMLRWIEEQRLEAEGVFYEYYYNDPDSAEEDLLTKVIIPVK